MKTKFLFLFLSLCLVGASCGRLFAQRVEPDHRDVPYDDAHPAQALDVYLAKGKKPAPVMVYIHGGGWRAGTKNRVPGYLLRAHAEGWLAVVSVEYRFTQVKPHPAQVNDCSRAIRFIRHKAKEWNLDVSRMGVTGGSAGGHLSAYVALRDETADPEAKDPVNRHSSRVSFAIPFAGPTDWGLLSEIEHRHPAYRELLGYEPGTTSRDMDAAKLRDVSPVSFASKDDPPVLIVHGDADEIVPVAHAHSLEKALRKAGVPVEKVILQGARHNVAGAGAPQAHEPALRFLRKHLMKKEGKGERPKGAGARP